MSLVVRFVWLALFAAFATAGGLELLLRLVGAPPWGEDVTDLERPVIFEPDDVLGWRNREGVYHIAPYSPAGAETHMTNWPEGLRAAAPERTEKAHKLVIVGDSFTQGWAISDEETYPWKLQSRFPELEVLNFGTGGYGTYQCLLTLERFYQHGGTADLVLYGFLAFHQLRNVARADWIRHLATHSRSGAVSVPYVTLDGSGRLIRHDPISFPAWPLRRFSSAVTLAEDAYAKWRHWPSREDQVLVTEKVVELMRDLAESRGSRFLVVVLGLAEEADTQILTAFERAGIRYLSCEGAPTPETTVPGEGHPNGLANTVWANCIERGIGRWEEPGHPRP